VKITARERHLLQPPRQAADQRRVGLDRLAVGGRLRMVRLYKDYEFEGPQALVAARSVSS
jgi:hypothetical protein